jgi:hypothetical protein
VSKLSADSQAVYEAMLPDFRNEDYAAGLIAGAEEILSESAGSHSGIGVGSVGLLGGILLVLATVAGGALLLRNRSRKRRELAENREAVEEEFAGLSSRMEELDEKERLVAGYLEAQRSLLDQATEEKVEAMIRNASAVGFGKELNEAAARLHSDPENARARISRGRELMEGAGGELEEAEKTIDDYRAADEALDGRLREVAEEIDRAEAAEKAALEAAVAVQPVGACVLSMMGWPVRLPLVPSTGTGSIPGGNLRLSRRSSNGLKRGARPWRTRSIRRLTWRRPGEPPGPPPSGRAGYWKSTGGPTLMRRASGARRPWNQLQRPKASPRSSTTSRASWMRPTG